ncbi:MAG TPA: alpha/beta hydrolase [Labilithrix sp.]|nr:alpha/beta hydrolase [Labilithrix sp.]
MATLAIHPVVAKDATPNRWLVVLHGILGSGANWRTFGRQLVAARPAWGVLLVDLRLHGDSQGFEPPHTIATAAHDIVEAIARVPGGAPTRAVLGHSFGGKVAIEFARQVSASPNGPLDRLFVIDSTPGARPDQRGSSNVRRVVELLTELPESFSDRNAFTTWAEERGVDRATAMWLAMNVRPVPNTTRFEFRLDIPSIRTMMDDYFAQDLWPVLENPPGSMKTHLIAGGKSEVMDAADLARGRAIPGTTVDVVPNAGHWVHVDAPDALRELVLGHLDS